MVFGLVNGILSLWAQELRFFVRPVYSKFLHNLVGLLAFITGISINILHYFLMLGTNSPMYQTFLSTYIVEELIENHFWGRTVILFVSYATADPGWTKKPISQTLFHKKKFHIFVLLLHKF